MGVYVVCDVDVESFRYCLWLLGVVVGMGDWGDDGVVFVDDSLWWYGCCGVVFWGERFVCGVVLVGGVFCCVVVVENCNFVWEDCLFYVYYGGGRVLGCVGCGVYDGLV